MKSFKEYMKEETVPYANVRSGEMDVGNSAVRDQINQLLSGVTHGKFITPYVALERVAKALANFHIFIPNQHFLEGDSGTMIWPVNQYGFKTGMNDQGEFVISGGTEKDETHGPHMGGEGAYIASAPQEDEYSIYFEYRLTECGMFMVFCELVSKEDLDEIMDDLEAELNDEGVEDEDEELNEEHLDEVSKKTLASYVKKASHDVATKSAATGRYADRANKVSDELKKGDYSNYQQGKKDSEFADKMFNKSWNRRKGIAKAVDKLATEEKDDAPFEPTGSTTNAKTPKNVAKRLAQKAMKQAKEKASNKK